jgi:glutathione S-transferase
MAAAFLKRSMSPQPQVDQALQQLPLASWESIRSTLEDAFETDEERLFRSNVPLGIGVVGSPLHKIRLFDSNSKKESDIRVTFYRDSAAWCPYCMKVLMSLEEKQIPYRVEKVNMSCYGKKPVEFLMLQPNGQIPVAIIDKTVYRQSNDILEALEEKFPNHKSLKPPADQQQQQTRAGSLLRLERQLFSAWMYWLTGPSKYKSLFEETLQQVEQVLTDVGPFFCGDKVCTVDMQYAPFLERMAASLLYYKGFQIRVAPNQPTSYPAINRWYDAMEQLPSYQMIKSDYYTHCWDLPPQLGGCTSEPAGEPFRQAINGLNGSWDLPLRPHNGNVEPDWGWASVNDAAAKREAVERVSANHPAIIQFAARGAGKKGMPPVSAPLADPYAEPSQAVIGGVDAMMRLVCLALLQGTDAHESSLQDVVRVLKEQGSAEYNKGVSDSLEYVRDRVGVPRDMKLPAARQLRAHLNWAIAAIQS